MGNPLNATDVSSATWLLGPSPTKTKSWPFSTARSPPSPPNLNTSPLPRLARLSRTLDCAKSVTPAHGTQLKLPSSSTKKYFSYIQQYFTIPFYCNKWLLCFSCKISLISTPFNFLTPSIKMDMSNKQDDDDEKTDEVQQPVCVKCD